MPATDGRLRRMPAVVPVVVLLAVALTLVGVRLGRDPAGGTAGATAPTPGTLSLPSDPTAVLRAAGAVPAAVLDAVGSGGLARVPIAVNGEPVLAGAVPRVIWVGSEGCAACAAMRWSMLVALSRFGTLSGVGLVASAADGPYPGTVGPTFRAASFSGASLAVTFYDSPAGVDPTAAGTAAAGVTPEDQALLARYDAPPYVADDQPSPFVLFAGQYVSAGSLFTPAVLDGLSAAAVAASLADPDSAAGRAVDGAANVLTAVLCVATADTPATVCGSSGVRAGAELIGRRTG